MFESRGRRNLSHLRAHCAQLDHLLPFDRSYDMFCHCRFLPFLCEERSTCAFIIMHNGLRLKILFMTLNSIFIPDLTTNQDSEERRE